MSLTLSLTALVMLVPQSLVSSLLLSLTLLLNYAIALVAESESAAPPSVGGEYALGMDVLEDRQEEFECLAAAIPRFASMLLAHEGDLDAPDIPTLRSYAEAITGTQWSLRRPVYGLRQAPREWHDTLRTTLAALGFAPSTADPLLFLRTDTSLPPFYALVYVDDLVFATADTEALTLVKSELQKRHTCTDLGELRSFLGLQITRDRARRTITLTQSHMVHQFLQRFGFQFSSPQPIPLSTSHSLSAPPSDESVEPRGPYPELVGCLMYLMMCTRPDLAYTLSLLARYVAPDASWLDESATQRSSQGYTFSLGSGSVSWRSTRSSSVLSSSCEVEIYAGAMAAQELRWLTYLLTDLGEQPRSPPVLYVDNKAMIALCQEHRLEHRTKHIALRYFLARELLQRGQLRLAYVATRANTVDVFTKALPPDPIVLPCTPLSLPGPLPSPALSPARLPASPLLPTPTPLRASTAAPICGSELVLLCLPLPPPPPPPPPPPLTPSPPPPVRSCCTARARTGKPFPPPSPPAIPSPSIDLLRAVGVTPCLTAAPGSPSLPTSLPTSLPPSLPASRPTARPCPSPTSLSLLIPWGCLQVVGRPLVDKDCDFTNPRRRGSADPPTRGSECALGACSGLSSHSSSSSSSTSSPSASAPAAPFAGLLTTAVAPPTEALLKNNPCGAALSSVTRWFCLTRDHSHSHSLSSPSSSSSAPLSPATLVTFAPLFPSLTVPSPSLSLAATPCRPPPAFFSGSPFSCKAVSFCCPSFACSSRCRSRASCRSSSSSSDSLSLRSLQNPPASPALAALAAPGALPATPALPRPSFLPKFMLSLSLLSLFLPLPLSPPLLPRSSSSLTSSLSLASTRARSSRARHPSARAALPAPPLPAPPRPTAAFTGAPPHACAPAALSPVLRIPTLLSISDSLKSSPSSSSSSSSSSPLSTPATLNCITNGCPMPPPLPPTARPTTSPSPDSPPTPPPPRLSPAFTGCLTDCSSPRPSPRSLSLIVPPLAPPLPATRPPLSPLSSPATPLLFPPADAPAPADLPRAPTIRP
ncbi:unnamed protein product [Closterium sp. NIES-54]